MTTTTEPPKAATEAPPADKRPPETPRVLHERTLDDWLSLGGSAAGSLAMVWIIYERMLPTSGTLGFLVCWYIAFVLLYAAVSTLSNPGPAVRDRVAGAAVHAGAVVVGLGLVSVVAYTFWGGRDALPHLNILTSDMAGTGPRDPLDQGGALHAIAGSLVQISIAIAITLPLGVGTAVYMTEVGGKLSRVVRTIVEAMTALPSIVAGLFIYSTLIILLGVPNSGFAASMAISVMMLPIIARASDVVLRVVPGGLREASLALGASRWQTVWRVVLPTARPGLATALILGVARGIGETSPVLLTSGASTFLNVNPFEAPMNSLPLYVFNLVRSGEPLYIARAFGAAGILLGLVLLLFVIARLVARQRIGRR
ncbi:phosphate ABC transporter permease PstA [Tenggerimyces flavus]|uniref:Phosphate transport system permease protein PstA n=1 Tax=Tenggerimyces flavus TaxID=1708749 RepID=A0ABV7YR36_9ACTN|nr:phosphate ABC transporter permease PstA [Tenggerimyces flavus]MBM7786450.1 phosphate transport system permease protein [Tenggerimyces flavus]